MPPADPTGLVRAYYDALDDGDYDRLANLLSGDFVQVRPDRTFDGREAFVSFMRDDRPVRGTTHDLTAVYRAPDGAVGSVGDGTPDGDDATTELAARGAVRREDGETLVAFVDVFTVADGVLTRLETYTR